jgi:alkylresorcinol/alkylpyrone synthase
MPRLAGLATAVPRYVITQDEAREGARRVFAARPELFERMAPIYDSAGIDTRRSAVPLDWYFAPHDWHDRSTVFMDTALDLLEDAARRCLDEAGIDAGEVDAIVTICSTGIATPSLDARLMERLPFRPDTVRLPVFGLGCAGGVLGLARAAALSRALNGTVLLLVVELCGPTFRRGDLTKSNVVATALFGDGAAAVLIRPEDGAPAVGPTGEHRWPGTLDVMGWSVEADGLGVIFSRDIPTLVRRDLRPAAEAFLDRHGLGVEDLTGFVFHPGGTKVVEALRDAFELPDAAMAAERAVLRRYGNMSAVTVLFVLAEKRRQMAGRWLLSALGPGFCAGFAVLDCG